MLNDIESAIKSTEVVDRIRLNDLANSIKEKSLNEPKMVAKLLQYGNDEEFHKAATILRLIGDLALTPLLNSINRENPVNLVWTVERIVNIQLDNRNRIVAILNEMTLDKRLVEEAGDPMELEDDSPSRRVCDEAYLMMRRLFALEDGEEEILENTDIFLDMTDEERDDEIDRARKTKKWISLVEKALEEEVEEEF
jgi:hypothetical protein